MICGGGNVFSPNSTAVIPAFNSGHLARLMSLTIFLGPGLAGEALLNLSEAARAIIFTR